MKELTLFCVLTFIFTYTAGQMGLWEQINERAKTVHNYEHKARELAKKMRLMQIEKQNLEHKISELKSENQHLKINRDQPAGGRTIASVHQPVKNDLVQFGVYKWSPEKLLGLAQQAFHFKKWEKASQFYHALSQHYPQHKLINDSVLFEAGIAAYEAKNYPWAKDHFQQLIVKFPSKKKSKYFRGAKLFLALSNFYMGDQDQFMATFNEFHQKYRNSDEYALISKYYNDLALKYDQK